LGWGKVGITGKTNKKYIRLHKADWLTGQVTNTEPYGSENTFCLTTSHGSFIIWQGDFVGITGNSATYGIGVPKLARELKVKKAEAEELLEAYWKKNWAVKKFARQQKIRVVNREMWVYNPVSRFFYSLRKENDVFSTINQGTGVFIFDSWVARCRKRGVKTVAQFHDEFVSPVKAKDKEEHEEKINNAVKDLNETLGLHVEIKCDTQYGSNYADVH